MERIAKHETKICGLSRAEENLSDIGGVDKTRESTVSGRFGSDGLILTKPNQPVLIYIIPTLIRDT